MDLLLLMAASENDAPKVAELLRAGAKLEVKVHICIHYLPLLIVLRKDVMTKL